MPLESYRGLNEAHKASIQRKLNRLLGALQLDNNYRVFQHENRLYIRESTRNPPSDAQRTLMQRLMTKLARGAEPALGGLRQGSVLGVPVISLGEVNYLALAHQEERLRVMLNFVERAQRQGRGEARPVAPREEASRPAEVEASLWNKVPPLVKQQWHEFGAELQAHIIKSMEVNIGERVAALPEGVALGGHSVITPIMMEVPEIPVYLPGSVDGQDHSNEHYDLMEILQLRQLKDPMTRQPFDYSQILPASDKLNLIEQRLQEKAPDQQGRAYLEEISQAVGGNQHEIVTRNDEPKLRLYSRYIDEDKMSRIASILQQHKNNLQEPAAANFTLEFLTRDDTGAFLQISGSKEALKQVIDNGVLEQLRAVMQEETSKAMGVDTKAATVFAGEKQAKAAEAVAAPSHDSGLQKIKEGVSEEIRGVFLLKGGLLHNIQKMQEEVDALVQRINGATTFGDLKGIIENSPNVGSGPWVEAVCDASSTEAAIRKHEAKEQSRQRYHHNVDEKQVEVEAVAAPKRRAGPAPQAFKPRAQPEKAHVIENKPFRRNGFLAQKVQMLALIHHVKGVLEQKGAQDLGQNMAYLGEDARARMENRGRHIECLNNLEAYLNNECGHDVSDGSLERMREQLPAQNEACDKEFESLWDALHEDSANKALEYYERNQGPQEEDGNLPQQFRQP